MIIEEINIDTTEKTAKDEIEIILKMKFDEEKIRNLILKDMFNYKKKSPFIIYSDTNVFSDKMREEVKIINMKDVVKLLKIRYEEILKKLDYKYKDLIPIKFIYMIKPIIFDDLEILRNVKSKFDYKLLSSLEGESEAINLMLDSYEKISYEQLSDDILKLLTFHTNVRDYALNKKFLEIKN